MRIDGGEVEVAGARLQDVARDLDAGDVGAAEGEDLPAENRGVAFLTGRIAPAARDRILRIDDELDGALGGWFELRVLGQAVGFAKGHRPDGMTVHIRHAGWADEEVA